jgi:hypothetical protein
MRLVRLVAGAFAVFLVVWSLSAAALASVINEGAVALRPVLQNFPGTEGIVRPKPPTFAAILLGDHWKSLASALVIGLTLVLTSGQFSFVTRRAELDEEAVDMLDSFEQSPEG